MSALTAFKAVHVVGTVLPHEALPRAAELRMPGQHATDYQLPPGMAVNAAIARAWEAMLAAHQQWQQALGRLPDADPAVKLTREKWLVPLLDELGWGHPEAVTGGLDVPPGLGDATALHFPVSHRVCWPETANPNAWAP